MTSEFHDAANIFPLEEETIAELAEDISKNGQRVPIERLDGKIIDGRRRYKACQIAGIKPCVRDIDVDDPIAYVLSMNLHRRQMTPSQRAMVGARARGIYDQQAKDKQKEAGDRGKEGGRGDKKTLQENLPEGFALQARDQVGRIVGVSGRSIDHATKVLNDAIPEVVKAVDEGRMSVSTAAILTTEPEEVQKEAAKKQTRNYKSTCKPLEVAPTEEEESKDAGTEKQRIKGIELAHEAINCLDQIPKNDLLRKRCFQIVTDWIKAAKKACKQ